MSSPPFLASVKPTTLIFWRNLKKKKNAHANNVARMPFKGARDVKTNGIAPEAVKLRIGHNIKTIVLNLLKIKLSTNILLIK